MWGGLALAVIAAATLSVEPTPEAAELRAMLVAELGAAVVVDEGGALRVGLRTREAALELEIHEARGERVLARRFELAEGRAAAMRGVVVAIARAVEATTPVAPSGDATPPVAAPRAAEPRPRIVPVDAAPSGGEPIPQAPPAPPPTDAAVADPIAPAPRAPADTDAPAPPLWLRLGAGLGGPIASPQLDLELAARLLLGERLDVGLAAGAQGLLCCTFAQPLASGADGQESELVRVRALATAALALVELGPLELSLQGGAGLLWQSLSTTPVAFAGGAPTHTLEGWSALGRLGAVLGGPLGGELWRWRLEAGLDAHGALSATLPEGFPGRGEPLDTGFLSPFARLMIELRTF